jgi:hypothetical protein
MEVLSHEHTVSRVVDLETGFRGVSEVPVVGAHRVQDEPGEFCARDEVCVFAEILEACDAAAYIARDDGGGHL